MQVLHIGACDGEEIEFYHQHRVSRLIYVEPDLDALNKLHSNIRSYQETTSNPMNIQVIAAACSSISGKLVRLNANGAGQSSLLEIGKQTKILVGDDFKSYEVETIALHDILLKECSQFRKGYLCIDTQGHEWEILKVVSGEMLNLRFGIIDIEIMTDPNQYMIEKDQWKFLLRHICGMGYQPLVMPKGVTESYAFINMGLYHLNSALIDKLIESIMLQLLGEIFGQAFDTTTFIELPSKIIATCASERSFHPLCHVKGFVHCTQLDRFRKLFLQEYCRIFSIIK